MFVLYGNRTHASSAASRATTDCADQAVIIKRPERPFAYIRMDWTSSCSGAGADSDRCHRRNDNVQNRRLNKLSERQSELKYNARNSAAVKQRKVFSGALDQCFGSWAESQIPNAPAVCRINGVDLEIYASPPSLVTPYWRQCREVTYKYK
ncbi:hypothetical protein EVAR_14397_1 [Eumeta japonica]|uniref:Uncharacterized protein n=1 Tax=Eumeta variegata TaxID=151549 RepID=A0A4C1TX86_EUMVA|nr:hypothetical protein EVAR_14397_1 [Eumeta japonica]